MEVPILKIPFADDDIQKICGDLSEMLAGGQLAMGSRVAEFEEKFAAFCGVDFALNCANGTAALEMMCRALNLEGASVAVPANTFMATALAPIAAGAKVILIDCEPDTFQMCPRDLARKMRPDTKAVILVHLGGFISPHWRQIKDLAESNGAYFLEDAAHAHGAEIDGKEAGSLGLAAAFSFFPTKVLTTAEGGMVTTCDSDLYETLKAMRQHGQGRPGSNLHDSFGLNYRPSEIHALLGAVMMAKAPWILEERRRGAALYDSLLSGSKLEALLAPEGQKPAYYKYLALLPSGVEREPIKARLKEEYRISLAGEVYAHPLHRQPFWAKHPEFLASPLESLPNCEEVAARQIALPLYPGLSAEAQRYVVESLLKVVG